MMYILVSVFFDYRSAHYTIMNTLLLLSLEENTERYVKFYFFKGFLYILFCTIAV